MADLKLYELPPSPNCTQVRIALGVKGIEFESVQLAPTARGPILDDVGVALTPGMKWGDIKLFDSRAIIRFIDVNFPGPRLFPTDENAFREVEAWERWAREEAFAPMGGVFAMALGRAEFDQSAIDQARVGVTETTRRVEEVLAKQPYLVGDEISAADIIVAARIALTCAPESLKVAVERAEFPFWPYFFEHTSVEEDRPYTHRWLEGIMIQDPLMQRLGMVAAQA